MKGILYALLIILPFFGCKKADKTRYFTLTATKSDLLSAVLEIDHVQYPFTDTILHKDINVDESAVISATLSSNSQTSLSLDLSDAGNSVGAAYGTRYIYMIIDNSGVYSTSANTGGTSNGTPCPTVQCSGTTQSGARCKRMTTNCSGMCWQH